MIRKFLNWFKNTRTREQEHAKDMFEVEAEHAYLNAAILQLWDYIAILETDIARKLLKLCPDDFKQKRKNFIKEMPEEEKPVESTWNGIKVFGGKANRP